jgi:hypothetical protein
MGHHSKGRPSRHVGGTPARGHGSHRAGGRAIERAEDAPAAQTLPPGPGPSAPDPSVVPAFGVGGRDLADLADAARTARRTGWGFGSEVLASADTRRVPSAGPSLPTTPTEQPPAGPRPRRYATHQPTAPFPAIRSA